VRLGEEWSGTARLGAVGSGLARLGGAGLGEVWRGHSQNMSTMTSEEVFNPGSIQAARDKLARLEADYPPLREFARDQIGLSSYDLWNRRANAMLAQIASLRWRIESHDRKTA
jgi:hypothetical protein